MKTETQIAEDKIDINNNVDEEKDYIENKSAMKEHKTSCERTKQKWIDLFNILKQKGELQTWVSAYIGNEFQDNQNAIKLYSENEI